MIEELCEIFRMRFVISKFGIWCCQSLTKQRDMVQQYAEQRSEMVKRAVERMLRRSHLCLERNGGHVEDIGVQGIKYDVTVFSK